MLSRDDILFGVALPAVLAIVLLAFTWQRSATPKGAWGAAVALALAVAVAFIAIHRRSPFAFADSLDWIFSVAIGLAILGTLDALFNLPPYLRFTWISLAAVFAFWTMLMPVINNWQTLERIGWIAALTIATVVWWLSLEGLAKRETSALTPIAFFILAGGTAALLALSGSLKLGQIAGALTGPLAICVLFALWRRSHLLMRGAVPVLAILLGGLVSYGIFFSMFVPSHAILLLLAPLFAFVAEVSIDPSARAWRRWAGVLGALLLPIGIAVALAYVSFNQNYYSGY